MIGPKRKVKTWTVSVPDDAEVGTDVLNVYVEDLGHLMGFHDSAGAPAPLSRPRTRPGVGDPEQARVPHRLGGDVSEGADFTATQDQAIAAVQEALRTEPHQFIFVFAPREPDSGDIAITMFCQTQFVFDTAQLLGVALAEAKPEVGPPPEG